MKRVFVCSRYAGDVEANVRTAENICRYIADQGHAPFAPHLLFTRFFDDTNQEEREVGIACGLVYMAVCDEVWVFVGNGISAGMRREVDHARLLGIPVREIDGVEA